MLRQREKELRAEDKMEYEVLRGSNHYELELKMKHKQRGEGTKSWS